MSKAGAGNSATRKCAECGKEMLVVSTALYRYKIIRGKTAEAKSRTDYYCCYSEYNKNKRGLKM